MKSAFTALLRPVQISLALAIFAIALVSLTIAADEIPIECRKIDGYHGIWYYNQKQGPPYVFKYSGGLGTYCAKHRPLAIYRSEVDRTFFCYGGTDPDRKTLWHMVSYFDHKTGTVPRPTMLLDKRTDDAHDNPVMAIDSDGYIFIFSTAHGTSRPSFILKSVKPYDIDKFERIMTTNFSYAQPFYIEGQGFIFPKVRYVGGHRTIYCQTSQDDANWTEPCLLSHIEQGHYPIAEPYIPTDKTKPARLGIAFNYHPNGRGLNWRTNVYYMETDDFGKTWKTIDGRLLDIPLTSSDCPARIAELESQKRNVYMKDLTYDADGRPVILTITSEGWQAGPANDPRIWTTFRWTGTEWEQQGTIRSDNNYDTGSLYIEADGRWRLIGPTETGPQPYNPGGEVAMWTSDDQGIIWTMQKQLTKGSPYNHTYCRRPVNAHPDFYAFWADGHAREKSKSRLYFTDKEGTHVWRLPEKMEGETAKPEIVEFDNP